MEYLEAQGQLEQMRGERGAGGGAEAWRSRREEDVSERGKAGVERECGAGVGCEWGEGPGVYLGVEGRCRQPSAKLSIVPPSVPQFTPPLPLHSHATFDRYQVIRTCQVPYLPDIHPGSLNSLPPVGIKNQLSS